MPFLTKVDVLIVLLEYIDLSLLSDNIKQAFGKGYNTLSLTILYCYILFKHSYIYCR